MVIDLVGVKWWWKAGSLRIYVEFKRMQVGLKLFLKKRKLQILIGWLQPAAINKFQK